MKGDIERLNEIESQMDALEIAYVNECVALSKEKGFDVYTPKWDKKMSAIAKKFADYLYPLKTEHDEIRVRLNQEEELKRHKKVLENLNK